MARGSPCQRLGGALQEVKILGSQNHIRGSSLRKHSNTQYPLLVFSLKALTWNLSIPTHVFPFHCWLISHYSPALLHHQGTSARCCAFHKFTFSFVSKGRGYHLSYGTVCRCDHTIRICQTLEIHELQRPFSPGRSGGCIETRKTKRIDVIVESWVSQAQICLLLRTRAPTGFYLHTNFLFPPSLP